MCLQVAVRAIEIAKEAVALKELRATGGGGSSSSSGASATNGTASGGGGSGSGAGSITSVIDAAAVKHEEIVRRQTEATNSTAPDTPATTQI